MGTGKQLTRDEVRLRLKKEVATVILEAMDYGYTVLDRGHGVVVVCPCGSRDHGPVSTGSTPKDPGREAKRLRHLLQVSTCWDNPSA